MVEIIHENPVKVDSYTLQTEKTLKRMPVQYTKNALIAQRASILVDMARYERARQMELDEIDGLLAEMDKLGIVEKDTKEEEQYFL